MGYLFPRPEQNGVIEELLPEKSCGYIDGCLFQAADLSEDIAFSELRPGQRLSFELATSSKFKHAKRLRRLAEPVPVSAIIKANRIEISAGEASLTVEITPSHITLMPRSQGKQVKFELNLRSCDAVAEVAVSLLAGGSFPSITHQDAPPSPPQAKLSVIDLCSVRPRVASDTAQGHDLPFRLLLQYWPEEYSAGEPLDCGEAKALALSPDTTVVSMRSLFSSSDALSSTRKLSAAMFFIKKIKEYLPTESLSYLLPDWGNDFELDWVRKSVNSYFDDATPIPRSIAAVCAWQSTWQSSNTFGTNVIREDDLVLVADTFDGRLAISPLQAVCPKGLPEAVPETRGFGWKLHPVFTVEDTRIHSSLAESLSRRMRCQVQDAREWMRLFGFDGLVREAGKLSLVTGDTWHHLPASVHEILIQGLEEPALTKEIFDKCLDSIDGGFHPKKVFILPLAETIRKGELGPSYHWLGSSWPLVEGARTLHAWQKRAGDDIPLWTSHLPGLSMSILRDGFFEEDFWLVREKDAPPVIPQRGKKISIPVKEIFTLPAGRSFYHFPLRQGQGKHELRFAAHIESVQFPLEADTDCSLQMTYTYGIDSPYELELIPINAAGKGRPFRVEWRPVEESTADLSAPAFPERKTWAELQKYPKDDGSDPSDLLKRCASGLRSLQTLLPYNSEPIPSEFRDKIFNSKVAGVEKKIFNLRFPVLTIWDNGRSLSEPDAPAHFRQTMFEGLKCALSIMELENTPETLKNELFFFLSSLHKDAPSLAADKLIKSMTDKKLLGEYRRNIAFSIGNAELPWQEKLLVNIINQENNDGLTKSIKMEILAIAFWRSEELVFRLTESEFKKLCHSLLDCLEFDLHKITQQDKGYLALSRHLELLFALLRMRASENEALKTLLAPGKELTKRYAALVEKASKKFIESGFKWRSRINLKVEKPKLCKIPDLLYALRMYLTGASGASTIWVTGIKSDG
jgi:hypothetical protein